jgi:hypothetical protein
MVEHYLHVFGQAGPLKIDDTLEDTVRMNMFNSPSNRVNAVVWQDATRKLLIPFASIVALESRPRSNP